MIRKLNSPAVKALVADFLVSAGVALGGIAIGTWGEAKAAAGVLTFVVVKTAVLAGVKAVLKWASS